MKKQNDWLLILLLVWSLLLTACSSKIQPASEGVPLKIVATTTIVGDIVTQVGGDLIDLSVLLPVGTDPHSFDPTPQDIAKVAEADIVFANGAGLEEFLAPLIESADAQDRLVHLSDNIELLLSTDEEDEDHEKQDHGHTSVNPHTWTDPNNVRIWVDNITNELSQLNPENAAAFKINATAYKNNLKELDAWIRERVTQIPTENRKLVTDHAIFGYFAQAYGLEQIGALIPGYSTLSEPSAQELAKIEDIIQTFNVKAIFVGNTVNPNLAERVAQDTGTKLVFVYTGSLSEPVGEASTYIDYMRYNTNAFVEALK